MKTNPIVGTAHRLVIWWAVPALLLVGGCTALAQSTGGSTPGAAPAAAAATDSAVDQLLDALDKRGQDLNALSANLKRSEENEVTGDTTSRSGQIWLQRKDDGSFRVHAQLDTKQVGDLIQDEKIEYVLDDGKLIDRNYRTRTQNERQVLRPGEKMNLFKLGEGPFPLPLGQKKEDVHAAFDVSKQPSDPKDPRGTVRVRLAPKPGTDLARKFKQIDAAVDVEQSMPVRIITTTPDDAVTTWDLTNVKINPPLTDKNFALEKIDEKKWNISSEPYER